ncbi:MULTISPECIES: circadian clock KaiB family protein [Thioalkalivibrio]|uniref:Circadian clock protein KaiB n=1 Tax=Thioalkalivibrio halophilus TaxID=252474 RepID=A0A1V3A030_9GAMM|nr:MULTISPECIES: circadian clock KaiB family protein [Thioalkalivibrio]OOC10704.1 circadian clock protein KaiB [Thioalkalivibrio halophilus]PYG01194.1 circadian clock protein KaiB [Thioalkalivibrio sp. ALE21]
MAQEYLLRLYVTGQTARSARALANLQAICEEELQGRYRIEVIDVLENPERGENERIVATPTLIRELPPPIRRIIGDLSDRDEVLHGLELVSPGQRESLQ